MYYYTHTHTHTHTHTTPTLFRFAMRPLQKEAVKQQATQLHSKYFVTQYIFHPLYVLK